LIDSVVFVPVESVFGNDSVSYVFKKARGKVVKQQVITGQSNENEIIIRTGLSEDDKVMMVPPEKSEELTLVALSAQEIEKYKVKPVIPDTSEKKSADTLNEPRKDKPPRSFKMGFKKMPN
jgi:hypothetical protein